MEDTLQDRISCLPGKPGVYLMKDKKGNVLYVGKAINLKKRVVSYFRPSNQKHPRTQALVKEISDFETIVVDSEVESLILECNLIKRYRPRFNIRLNDDSNFLYLKLTTKELYPKILTARRVQKDLASYYGPHPKSREVRQTLVLIRKLFNLRACNIDFEKKKLERPCLDYHIKLCSGPCANLISQAEYQEQVNSTCLFLNGELEALVEKLTKKMDTFAVNLKFEEASRLRDQLRAIQDIQLRQRIISPNQVDRDIIGIAQESGLVCIQLMFIRSGKLIGQAHYFLDGIETYEEVDYLNEFLKQYYLHKSYIVAKERRVPQEIILSATVPEKDLILQWLRQKLKREVTINTTSGDQETRMIDLANKNAKNNLEQRLGQPNIRRQIIEGGLEELQTRLHIPSPPFHIEGIDISTLQGENTVGSLVYFTNGEPDKKEYRRFKIRNVGQDDYAAIEEVVHRRISRLIKEKREFPDLLLIDGGLGQLHAAQSA
ncbi:MAG: excinuclease ABC subunit UvrC, partial [Candidatus Ranarchaeia archaeon]